MSQLIEFMGNHPFLSIGFLFTLGMLGWTEYTRLVSKVNQLSPFAATRLMNEGETLLVDVRTEKEYKAAHLAGAKNIPTGHFERHEHEIEKFKDKPVILYCDSGVRSQRAANQFAKAGFTNLNNLAGGLNAWQKANLPVGAA